MSEYIEKLENILEGVENYRFDDMSCAEWEELTTHVLKGAIAREKANQEADELASSIWDRLENLSEPKLNENQESVLEYGKTIHIYNFLEEMTCQRYLTPDNIQDAMNELDERESLEVMKMAINQALDQC